MVNVQASRKLMALALQCKPEELATKFTERQGKPIAPVEVKDAPVHEVVKVDADVDLTKVPLLTHYDVNAAPYITAGIVVAADPDSGVRNTSYNRLMMARKRELRIFMAVGRHLWTLHNKLERRKEPLPIAIVIGVHPLFSLGAQAFTPSTEDEYAVIGGMMERSAARGESEDGADLGSRRCRDGDRRKNSCRCPARRRSVRRVHRPRSLQR